MPKFSYMSTTILLYIIEIIAALLIDDIGLIFEWLSAFAISCIAFIWPGVFYLLAERKYSSTAQIEQNKGWRLTAYAFVVIGLFNFVFFMTANVLEIIEDS